MEVLLKSGADVKAVDTLGHDAFHYARLSKNPELVGMVKTHLEKITRGQSYKILISIKIISQEDGHLQIPNSHSDTLIWIIFL